MKTIKRIFHNIYEMRGAFFVLLGIAFCVWFCKFYYNNKDHILVDVILWTTFFATTLVPLVLNVIVKIKERKTRK